MVQDGARQRYMDPLALHMGGILDRAFIDWFVRKGSIESAIAAVVGMFRPQLGRRMAERSCPELQGAHIISNPWLALRVARHRNRFPREEDFFIWAAEQQARWIKREGFGSANVLRGYVRCSTPEFFQFARSQGLRTAADQMIAPLEVEVGEMRGQVLRWPGWSDGELTEFHPAYHEMEVQSWEALDRITVMSDYVRQGLESLGVPRERITVIPYPWIKSAGDPPQRGVPTGPLTVGFTGVVGLRKGAPWFLEVARRFDPARVRFVMVGSVRLNPDKRQLLADRVELVGNVTRGEALQWLKRFDLFLFPTTCEGSAGSVQEAMAFGMPVITTPNSGSKVRDGIDGFIHRYDDVEGFVQSIRRLDDDRELLYRMGQSARQRVLSYDLAAYRDDLVRFFRDLVNSPGPDSARQSTASASPTPSLRR
jgi:hypothetical protein